MSEPAAQPIVQPMAAPIAVVTGEDLLKQFADYSKTLHAIEIAVSPLPAAIADVKSDVGDHEIRLRTIEGPDWPVTRRVSVLERSNWKRQGAVTLAAALLSSGIVTAIIEVLHK